jgi:hypothetical protein
VVRHDEEQPNYDIQLSQSHRSSALSDLLIAL